MGLPEILIVALIIVVLFGASRLPKLGGAMGESLRNFKSGLGEGEESEADEQVDDADRS